MANEVFGADLPALRSGTDAGRAIADALARVDIRHIDVDAGALDNGDESEDRQTTAWWAVV